MKSPTATYFPNVYCSTATVVDISWAVLFSKLQEIKVYNVKKEAPLIKLAKFGSKKSKDGSLKYDDNYLELLGIEGDYDDEIIPIEEACQLLERHGIRAILYTSWSSTPCNPRWRVLAPISKPHGKEAHARFVARLNGALGGVLAGESFTLSQGYFIGKNPTQPYTCICTFNDPNAGEFIDLLDVLDESAMGKSSTKKQADKGRTANHPGTVEDWLAGLLEGEDINGNALRLVGRMVKEGMDDAVIMTTFTAWKDKLIEARGAARVNELFNGGLPPIS